MDTKIVKKKFWKLVWARFKKSYLNLGEIKSNLLYIVSLLVYTILFAVLFSTKTINWNLFNNAYSNLLLEILFTILPIIATLTSLLFRGYTEIPAKMYEEQGGFVTKSYELSPEPHPDKIGNIDYTRTINIKTTTHFDITECRIKLTNVINIQNNEDILRRPEDLKWSDREGRFKGEEPKTIQGNGQSRLCEIARWTEKTKSTRLAFSFGSDQKIPEGEYLINIEVTGKWQGHNFKEKEEMYLRYQDPKIELGKKLDELEILELV